MSVCACVFTRSTLIVVVGGKRKKAPASATCSTSKHSKADTSAAARSLVNSEPITHKLAARNETQIDRTTNNCTHCDCSLEVARENDATHLEFTHMNLVKKGDTIPRTTSIDTDTKHIMMSFNANSTDLCNDSSIGHSSDNNDSRQT